MQGSCDRSRLTGRVCAAIVRSYSSLHAPSVHCPPVDVCVCACSCGAGPGQGAPRAPLRPELPSLDDIRCNVGCVDSIEREAGCGGL